MKAVASRFLFFSLLISFYVGCTPVPVTLSKVDVPYPTSTSTGEFAVTPTTVLPTFTATSQPLVFYFPEIEERCPENRDVAFDMLDVNKDLSVILIDRDQTGLWKFSAEHQEPTLIKTLPFTTWYGRTLNPTGEYLAFIVRNDDNSSSIWLLSLSSGDEKEIFKIDYFEGAFPNIHWVSNNDLLVNGSCAGAGCPFPIKILNIANGFEMDVEDTYVSPYDNYINFVVNAGEYLAIYGTYADNGYSQFYAYDYIADRKLPIFPWLDKKIYFYPLIGTNLGLLDAGNYFVMTVKQSYGFDVSVIDADIENFTQDYLYDSVMRRVFTEIQFGDLKYSLIDLNQSNKSLMLSLSYTDYIDDTVNVKDIENALFAANVDTPVLDDRMDRLVFVDYCFTTTEYFNLGFSPDGQIEVFRSDDEIVFLNLKTGNISRLSGWSFVGWAK